MLKLCSSCRGRHQYTLIEFPGAISHDLCRSCAQQLVAEDRDLWIDCTSPSFEALAA